jgi:pectate disaccharide-lyase
MREGTDAARARSDEELAIQLQADDAEALAQLYGRHVRGIHDFLARFTRDAAVAEGLAHSTFLRAWERRASLREPSRARSWLYATAHNLAVDHVARDRSASSIDEETVAAIAQASPGPEEREVSELVWAAASSLRTRQYAVLDLSVRHAFSTREVADVLGVTASHGALLVNRAREALGSAVRYLLVTRRRDQCVGLAMLAPAGVSALDAGQRGAVDHHLRRCETCRALGARLAAPAELLGALLPLRLPTSLGEAGQDRLLTAIRAQPATAGPGGSRRWPPRRWDRRVRPRWLGALAGLLALVTLGAILGHLWHVPPARATVQASASLPGITPDSSSDQAPSATPSPVESPSPPPVVAAVAVTPTPAPPRATRRPPTPVPPPAPPPALAVVRIDVAGPPSCLSAFR